MKNVVITGANRGIGLALVQHYCAKGDRVWALCRNSSDELDATDAEIINGFNVENHSDFASVLAPLKDIQIDLLINNAGILRNESLGNINTAQIREQMRIEAG